MTALEELTDHVPMQPSWDCQACRRPWPCEPARHQLAAAFGPVRLRLFCWTQFELAAVDMRDKPTGELLDRFVRWTRAID